MPATRYADCVLRGRMANGLSFMSQDHDFIDVQSPVLPLSTIQQLHTREISGLPAAVDIDFYLRHQIAGRNPVKVGTAYSFSDDVAEGTVGVNPFTILSSSSVPLIRDEKIDLVFGGEVVTIGFGPEQVTRDPDWWEAELEPLFYSLYPQAPLLGKPTVFDPTGVSGLFRQLARLSPSQITYETFQELVSANRTARNLMVLREQTRNALVILSGHIKKIKENNPFQNVSPNQVPITRVFQELIFFGSEPEQPDFEGEPGYYTLPLAARDFECLLDDEKDSEDQIAASALMRAEIWPLMNLLVVRLNIINRFWNAVQQEMLKALAQQGRP